MFYPRGSCILGMLILLLLDISEVVWKVRLCYTAIMRTVLFIWFVGFLSTSCGAEEGQLNLTIAGLILYCILSLGSTYAVLRT